jgi:hypothetical protein
MTRHNINIIFKEEVKKKNEKKNCTLENPELYLPQQIKGTVQN